MPSSQLSEVGGFVEHNKISLGTSPSHSDPSLSLLPLLFLRASATLEGHETALWFKKLSLFFRGVISFEAWRPVRKLTDDLHYRCVPGMPGIIALQWTPWSRQVLCEMAAVEGAVKWALLGMLTL